MRASAPTYDSSSATAAGAMRLDEPGDAVEDRLQPELRALARGRSPPAVVERPEAPVVFVDDAVPASSRPWVDAETTFTRRD